MAHSFLTDSQQRIVIYQQASNTLLYAQEYHKGQCSFSTVLCIAFRNDMPISVTLINCLHYDVITKTLNDANILQKDIG